MRRCESRAALSPAQENALPGKASRCSVAKPKRSIVDSVTSVSNRVRTPRKSYDHGPECVFISTRSREAVKGKLVVTHRAKHKMNRGWYRGQRDPTTKYVVEKGKLQGRIGSFSLERDCAGLHDGRKRADVLFRGTSMHSSRNQLRRLLKSGIVPVESISTQYFLVNAALVD